MEIANVRQRRDSSMRMRIMVGAIVVTLWLATIFASDAPIILATLIWAAGGATFYFWARRDFVKERNAHISYLEKILGRDTADVFSIEATAFAELRHANDEVSMYAFQIADARLVFILPPDTSRPGFPSLNFEIVHYADDFGAALATRFSRNTVRSTPTKLLNLGTDAECDQDDPDLDEPEYFAGGHLEIIAGTIDTLETVLSQRRGYWDMDGSAP